MTPTLTLVPCPFCEGTNVSVGTERVSGVGYFSRVVCGRCGVVVDGELGASREEAIEGAHIRWNRRPVRGRTGEACNGLCRVDWARGTFTPGAGCPVHDATPPAPATRVQLATTRKDRVYIAGPMTGIAEFNAPAFNAEAAVLRANGMHVENPAEHGIVEGATWADYLHYDLTRLATCEAIFLLPGWTHSKGACLELRVARALGMKIFYSAGAERSSFADIFAILERERIVREIKKLRDNHCHDTHGECNQDGSNCDIVSAWNDAIRIARAPWLDERGA